MREIKFKLYDPESGYMTKALTINDIIDIKNNPEGIAQVSLVYEWKTLIWLRFTGLCDKHGKEIFEGDILGGILGCGVVEYNEKLARYVINICGEIHEIYFNELKQEQLIIIGDIYQNPELLENAT